MPGWTQSWLSHDIWRIMKEHMQEFWVATIPWLCSCLEPHSMGGDQPWPPWLYMNSTQMDVSGLRVKNTQWILSVITISAFYFFDSLYTILFSLSKGKGSLFGEEISIPNWGSHWSYVCAWMSVYAIMCGCVCAHESVQREAVAALVLWYIFFFWCPIVRTSTATFCHSPADDWVCCLCRQEREWQNTWCEHATRTLLTWISTESEELSFLPQRAPVYSLILFDWPLFDLDKKVWWGPLEVLCGYDVTSEYFLLLDNSRGVARFSRCIQRDCCADPKCCMQHLLGDWQWLFTQIFFRPKRGACGFGDRRP